MVRSLIKLILISILFFTAAVSGQAIPGYNMYYSGTIKYGVVYDKGSRDYLPEYRLYVYGCPVTGLYVAGYLDNNGEIIDGLYSSYSNGNFKGELGDITLDKFGGSFIQFNQQQRGGYFSFSIPGRFEMGAAAARIEGINEEETLTGNGTSGPYYLSYTPVIPGSESVERGGVILKEDEYELDYLTGRITFKEPLKRYEEAKVSYMYQPTGGYFERFFKGLLLSGTYKNWETKLNVFQFEDQPLSNPGEINLIPGSQLAGVLNIDYKNDYLEFINEIDMSKIRGQRDSEDIAYEGRIKVGSPLNYLEYGRIYRGPDFINSLESFEADPLSLQSLEGRWQVNPRIYITGEIEYSHDNPGNDPGKITGFESLKSLKGYWQQGPFSYVILHFQHKDRGDDLVYLPTGEDIKTFSVTYSYHNNNSWVLSIKRGKLLKKSQSARFLNHYFNELESSLDWTHDMVETGLNLDLKYVEPLLPEAFPDRLDYTIKYDLAYLFSCGRVSIGGMELSEPDYTLHLQELSLKKYIKDDWLVRLKWEREREEYPGGDGGPENKVRGMAVYYGPVMVNTMLESDFNGKKRRGWLKLTKGQGELTFNYNENSEFIEKNITGKIDITSKIKYQQGLTRKVFKENGPNNNSTSLKTVIRFNDTIKLNFSLESPLPVNDFKDSVIRLELILDI
ncbi:hypothetical protein [Halothermothrix orenii]|uniref:Uncharacterized protein n=1 Tax=Halothermothrix orenii (strain H 168 / OCM 544 / DSM 9562) TaxID=373903 RepID=B8CZF5_HALOH|nr:hypothetical protein [Halothermothrix orenii]ACL70674.1 hypothetical protein Hore_19270 [Halothermothrix orenii H 168]